MDTKVVCLLATEYQVPWMDDGYQVSGLYMAAICIFLVFVASIALVVACLSGGPKPTVSAGKKKN